MSEVGEKTNRHRGLWRWFEKNDWAAGLVEVANRTAEFGDNRLKSQTVVLFCSGQFANANEHMEVIRHDCKTLNRRNRLTPLMKMADTIDHREGDRIALTRSRRNNIRERRDMGQRFKRDHIVIRP